MNFQQLKSAKSAILADSGEVVTIRRATKLGRFYVVIIERENADFTQYPGTVPAQFIIDHFKSINGIFNEFKPVQ